MSASKVARAVSEREVERYLQDQVALHGGRVMLQAPRGEIGIVDATVVWPRHGWAKIDLVEVKTIGGALEKWQERLHAELRKLGCHVKVIWTKAEVDQYVKESSLSLAGPVVK